MKLYVGNLPREYTEEDLRTLFGPFGTVLSVTIILDRQTGQPRGFGFVEMSSKEEGERAIAELNGREVNRRALVVNEARPPERAPRGDFGDRRSSPRGGGGGGGFRGREAFGNKRGF